MRVYKGGPGSPRVTQEHTMAAPRQPHAVTRRQLIDIAGVAERLGVSVRHVRRLVLEHRIPYLKWGRLLRFDPDEIDTWIETWRRPPHP